MSNCACGERAEWADKWCQMCWEAHCCESFWNAVERVSAVRRVPRQTVIDADGSDVVLPTGYDVKDFGYVPSEAIVTLPTAVQRELFGVEQMSLLEVTE